MEIVVVVNQEYIDLLQDRNFEKTYTDMTFKIIYTFRFQGIRSAEQGECRGRDHSQKMGGYLGH